LSYLKGFQLDTLKIDRTFVAELITSDANESIVRATIGPAQGLCLKTVAEGADPRRVPGKRGPTFDALAMQLA